MKSAPVLLYSFVSFMICALVFIAGCGRAPSTLLRQGQSPVFDFPLYVSEGAPGNIWKYEADQTRTQLVTGLQDPRGVATDRSNNLYVVEQGLGRLLKVDTETGDFEVLLSGLQTPNVVAVNSFGEVFVSQEGANNIIRNDGEVVAEFDSRPTALAFGVEDLLIVGLFDEDLVQWGLGGPTASVTDPVNIGTDATGRIFVAEGSTGNAEIVRFHQKTPTGETVVANQLSGPSGMAVDPVGNIYLVEQGASRIDLITHDGQLFTWASDVIDPQYLTFTQY